jgi:putative endonuclease
MFYVYIVECADKTYYTGYTDNIERRVKEHNNGKGARYTRGRLPVKCIYHEEYSSKSQAMQREYQIKKLNRKGKEDLISEVKNHR